MKKSFIILIWILALCCAALFVLSIVQDAHGNINASYTFGVGFMGTILTCLLWVWSNWFINKPLEDDEPIEADYWNGEHEYQQ